MRSGLIEKLKVLPRIYKGQFVDIDEEINRAYKKYPFPWPSEKQYENYTDQDVLKNLEYLESALEEFLDGFHLGFDFFKDKVVIDLGAGVGWDSFCFAKHGAKMVYAIDNSETSIGHGQRFGQMLEIENVKFFRCSLYELNRLEAKADVIMAKGVLHHIFDLPGFVKTLRHVSHRETELLLAHSSYCSRLGFTHYFLNHLAWIVGGADLEKRIDAGIKLFKGWHWQLNDKLVRHRVNDLAGVFYMARSSRQIKKVFQNEEFVVKKTHSKPFSHFYPQLKKHHHQMLMLEHGNAIKATRRRMAINLVLAFQFLSHSSRFMDRFLGWLYHFLFSMPPHMFRARWEPSTGKLGGPREVLRPVSAENGIIAQQSI